MVSQINLGNIYQQGNKTVLSGAQSGIDTKSLIEALTAAKRQPAVDLETKNTTLADQKTAYASLKSLLATFKSAVDVLRSPPGVQNASQNIFEYRNTTLKSNTSVAASSYLSVSAEPGTVVQNFTINEIGQLAQEAKQHTGNISLADTTAAAAVTASGVHTAGLFSAGTFTLAGIDGAADQDITLEENDTLSQVVNKFNAVKSFTGIAATIIMIADGDPDNTYQINFTGTKTGEDYDFDLSDVPGGVGSKVTADNDGVLSMLGFAVPTQVAQNAELTIDGVAVERSTNAIDDLIEGMTFTLQQETPALTTLTLGVEPDTSIVANAVTAFADAYNAFKLFASTQQERNSDGTPKDTAKLANDSVLRNIISTINTEVNNIVDGITAGNPDTLADIGITFDNFEGDLENPATKNIMIVDADALSSALTADFDGVRGVFEYQMTSDDENLSTFARTNALGITSFTLNIDRNTSTYEVRDSGTNALITTLTPSVLTNGVTLAGQSGTVMEGLELIFISEPTTTATINVSISQGIGDRLFNVLDAMLDDQDGTMNNAIAALDDQVAHNDGEIARIDDQVTTYRDQLTQKYATLEAALTKANQLLALLTAQSQAQAASAGG